MKYTLISIFIILLNSAFTIQAIESKPQPNEQFSIKFAAYNVLFGLWGAPESIGEKLKKYNLDIICFNEVPNGDWTKRVGTILNLNHTYVGEISSANHKNKYKSIHNPAQQNLNDSAAGFIAENIIKTSNDENLIILGDLNNKPKKGALKAFYAAGMKSIWNELKINKSMNSTHKHIESGKESGIIDHIFLKVKPIR